MTIAGPFYIYGVVATAQVLSEDSLHIGLEGAPVRLWPAGDLAVLVSAISAGPLAQTRRNMIAHTTVLERATAHATILPVRFGTVAPDETALASCLGRHASVFRQALHDIDGRIELGVKASWRTGRIFNDLIQQDPELEELRDQLRSRPAHETFYERVELGRRVERGLAERRQSETDKILQDLLPLAERAVELRILDDDMILNRAFLVRRTNESAFDVQIEKLAKDAEGRVDFKYIGPVPPYNFVNVQAGWMSGGV